MEPTFVQVPPSLKSFVPLLDEIFALTDAAIAHARSELPLLFPAWESLCLALGAALMRGLTQAVLQACERDERRLWVQGRAHRPVGRFPATFYSFAGPILVVRMLYRPLDDKNARTLDPVAIRVGAVRKTWLPLAASSMAFLVQQQPAREAAETAARLGVLPYHASSFEAVTQALGALYQKHAEPVEEGLVRQLVVPSEATGIVVSLDRVSTPLEESKPRGRGRPRKKAPKKSIQRVYRMAYCATVSYHDKNGKALHTIRYGCMPNEHIESLVEGLRDDVRAMLEQRPELRVSVLCDGAKEMWNLLGAELTEEALGKALQRLVDLWHLLEKVGKALRVRYDAQRASKELQRWKMRLLNTDGTWEKLRQEVESWRLEEPATQGKERSERPVHDALTFLANQGKAGRLDYAKARREGRPVGSGPVEATCKSLFNVRLKRGGARWKEERAGRVIKLRALALSQRWDAAMALLLPFLRGEIRRVA